MSKLVELKQPPRDSVITRLEELLERALLGEVQGFTYFYVDNQAKTRIGAVGDWNKADAVYSFFMWTSHFVGISVKHGEPEAEE